MFSELVDPWLPETLRRIATSLDAGLYKTEPFAMSRESREISRCRDPSLISRMAEFADFIASFWRSQLTSSASPCACTRMAKAAELRPAAAATGMCFRMSDGTLRRDGHEN